MVIPSFVDRVKLTVQAGDGDRGHVSVHREKFKPPGGPDSGNGGDEGSMIPRVVDNLNSLVECHRQSARRATNGQPGRGGYRHGTKGGNVVLTVPTGTAVSGAITGGHLADLTGSGEEYVAAVGGRGGFGNEAPTTAARKAPGFVLLGEEGEPRLIQLGLEVLADIGPVGFPPAGRLSLIAVISRARPKIADYSFTTLMPNLGVVVTGDLTYTVADVSGLIRGALLGKDLGFDFLRYIERCQAIVHIIDLGTWEPGREPTADLDAVEGELAVHGGLEDRGRPVVLNRLDPPSAPDLVESVRPELEKRGYRVFGMSTKTGERLDALKFTMTRIVETHRAAKATEGPPEKVLRPKPVGRITADDSLTIVKKDGGGSGFLWQVRGVKPERWIRQTDFSNVEVVGYPTDRLNRLGVEEKLLGLGAREGNMATIGDDDTVMFGLAPQVETGVEILSRQGEDPRLESERPVVVRWHRVDAKYHARKAGEVVDED